MRVLVSITAVLLLAHVSHAEPPRYARKSNLTIDVRLSERVRPVQPAKKVVPQPTVSADALLEIEHRTQPIRREQEALLIKLVDDTPDDDPEKADYLFRLAEHYAQQLRFWRLESVGATMPRRGR